MSEQAIIKMENVTKVYLQGKIETRALDNFSIDIHKGDFAALCGPSGSGKTTTLNIVGALDVATSGKTFLEGRELSELSRSELSLLRRDRIGFVFQSYNLIPVLSAFENAEFVLALQGKPKDFRKTEVMNVLAEVGLQGLEDRRPDELSGGQQQRVAVARAIVTRPAVVLADEPTANLDSAAATSLLDMMENLNTKLGITFLFSTHDQRVLERARRIIRLRDGRLESDETSQKVA
jgi:putative ABC transport system ATP-binding protein